MTGNKECLIWPSLALSMLTKEVFRSNARESLNVVCLCLSIVMKRVFSADNSKCNICLECFGRFKANAFSRGWTVFVLEGLVVVITKSKGAIRTSRVNVVQ